MPTGRRPHSRLPSGYIPAALLATTGWLAASCGNKVQTTCSPPTGGECPAACSIDDACYEPRSNPSFVRDVYPLLRQSCAFVACHGSEISAGGGLALAIAPIAVEPTRSEAAAAYEALLANGSEWPERARVVAGEPSAGLLPGLLDCGLGCMQLDCPACTDGADCAGAGCAHQQAGSFASGPSTVSEVLRDWILHGAKNDAGEIPPVSITPTLVVPLRVHTVGSTLSDAEVLELIDELARMALPFGICFDAEVAPFSKARTDDDVWLDGSGLPGAGVPGSGGYSALALQVGANLQLVPDPDERRIVETRRWAESQALQGTSGGCPEPRILPGEPCASDYCLPETTDLDGSVVPGCCLPSGQTCGIEPASLMATLQPADSLFGPFIAACESWDSLLAPISATCGSCTSECPSVVTDVLPVVGSLELPGCCRPDGTCGVDTGALPKLLARLPSCVDEAGLDAALGKLAPEPPVAVEALVCTRTLALDGGAVLDPSCPATTTSLGGAPPPASCCTGDGWCGFVMGTTCTVSQFTAASACSATAP